MSALCRMVAHAVIPPDLVERLWGVWHAAPRLCTVTLPVIVKRGVPPPLCRGLRRLGREFQYRYLVGQLGQKLLADVRLKESGQDLVRPLPPLLTFATIDCEPPFRSAALTFSSHAKSRTADNMRQHAVSLTCRGDRP